MTRARNSANLASHGNLFVDITNDRTGIGSVVPGQSLHVAGTAGFHADVTFTGDLYNTTWDRSDNSLKFVDNAVIKMGNNNDLSFSHDGTASRIQDSYGALFIGSNLIELKTANLGEIYLSCNANGAVSLRHNNVTKFETTAYGTNTTGTTVNDGLVVAGVATVTTMNVTGVLTYDDVTSVDSVGIVTARSGISVPDSQKINVGTGNDLFLEHDGNNSVFRNTTGDFYIQNDGSGTMFIQPVNNVDSIRAVANGRVELAFAGNKKFETTAYGIDVTGTTGTDGLVVSGVSTFSGIVAAGVGSTAITLSNSHKMTFGSAHELEMYHDGSNSYIRNKFHGYPSVLNIISENSGINIMSGNGSNTHNGYENAIVCDNNGAVKLYWSGTKHLETYGAGVMIQGNLQVGRQISHHGDTDTMMEFPSLNTISFQTAGSERARITSGGNVNIGGDYTQTSQKVKVTGNTSIDGSLTVGVSFICAGGYSINSGNVTQHGYTFHDADSDTYFGFPGNDQFSIFTAGSQRFNINTIGHTTIYSGAHDKGLDLLATANSRETRFRIQGKASDGTEHTFYLHAKQSANRLDIGGTGPICFIDSSQNVGVHNAIPTSPLHVGDDVNPHSTKALLFVGPASGDGQFHLRGGSPTVFFDSTSSGNPKILTDGADLTISNGTLDSNGTELVRIKQLGSVRIGDNSSFSAHTNADNLVVGTTSGSHGMTLLTGSSTGTIFFNDGSANDGVVQFIHSSSPNVMRIASSGYIRLDASAVSISDDNIDPSAGDLASGASFGVPRLHMRGNNAQSGAYELMARFQSGTDANDSGATIVLNHSNDRGLALQGGRGSSNRSFGAIKAIDNLGRLSDVMKYQGENGQGVEYIKFYTGASTTTTERFSIASSGKIYVGSDTTDFSDAGTFFNLRNNSYGGRIGFSNNTATAGATLMEQFAYWGTNKVSGFIALAGTDTSNKDDGLLAFYTRESGQATAERLRITSAGSALFGGLTSQANTDTSKLAVQGGGSNIGIIQVHAGGGENGGDLSGIAFSHGTDNSTARAKCAIASRATGAYGRGELVFYVDGASDNNQVAAADEKLRITTTGQLQLRSDDGLYIRPITDSNDAKIIFSTNNNNSNNQIGHIKYNHQDDLIVSGYGEGFILGGTESNGCILRVDGGINIKDSGTFGGNGGKISLGTDQDMRIYHTGGDGFIDGTGTGGFRLRYNDIIISNYNSSGTRRFKIHKDQGMDVFATTNGGLNGEGVTIRMSDHSSETQIGSISYRHSDNSYVNDGTNECFKIHGTENQTALLLDGRMYISDSKFVLKPTFSSFDDIPSGTTTSTVGCMMKYHSEVNGNSGVMSNSAKEPFIANRSGDDGMIMRIRHKGNTEGQISVSGSSVSYSQFMGSHKAQFVDHSKPDILIGTVLETVDQLATWKYASFSVGVGTAASTKYIPYYGSKNDGETDTITFESNTYNATIKNHRDPMPEITKHVCVKVSDTVGSKAVFGVFNSWENEDVIERESGNAEYSWNDLNVASIGNYFIRMQSGKTPEVGDYVESSGDGTAKVQSDDILRSKTIAKITSTTKQKTYDDGSFIVTCTLHCG